jgi:pimeloyl-ACP methyl ester carboxylesterase
VTPQPSLGNWPISVELHVHRWGSGPPVVLVHGSILGGREAFIEQRPLTERWTLLAPDRIGHGGSPAGRSDFELDARLVAEQLLSEPVHLVGYSYGGIVSMLAALQRPENVRTLTVVEPPSPAVARGVPAVDEFERRIVEMTDNPPDDDAELLDAFLTRTGGVVEVADPIPEPLLAGTRALRDTRHPSEAEIPLEDLAAAEFPILVVSGGHSDAFDAICDAIAEGTRARREVVPGAGHLVPMTGEPFNALLEDFWSGT